MRLLSLKEWGSGRRSPGLFFNFCYARKHGFIFSPVLTPLLGVNNLWLLAADLSWRGNALYFMNVQREGIKVEGKRKTKKEPESLVSADNSQRLNWAPTDIHPSERGRNRTMKAESGQSVRNLKPHSLHFCLPRSSDQNHFHSPLSVWLIFTPPLQKDEGRTRKNV